MRPAVFLDRDGTLIDLVHHLADPAEVRLMAGAADALERLRAAGYVCVLVTNQSAVGRGLLTLEGLELVHQELLRQLGREGTTLDGFYFCTLKPEVDDPTVIEHPDRKPGPGMLIRASKELGLDLSRSWMVGDTISDMLAGRNAGCRGTILVQTGYGKKVFDHKGAIDHVVSDLPAASMKILALDRAPKEPRTGSERT